MRLMIAALGSRPRAAFDDLARLYLDRSAALLTGGGKKSAIETPLFRNEDAFWTALDHERARTVPLIVLLDERGQTMDSTAFAAWLGRERSADRQLIVFALGPADGWSQASRQRAGRLFSLGPMTMAHELARIVLAEQLYRALTILAGHPYHREGSKNA
ncbi:MAG TPA: 23S rRNA (pseudouridine(1915)-N(3))-methyltransferase RlmH [Acidobacteriaceae bacterium]|jgi:23S rRNA (pseudouridine1915-N3)-methyltransferase|nr:23S rRNA (pseudouridine(1915)-N(3))-methyltransferase RlmH [Acidobacteriaceae bacterium]